MRGWGQLARGGWENRVPDVRIRYSVVMHGWNRTTSVLHVAAAGHESVRVVLRHCVILGCESQHMVMVHDRRLRGDRVSRLRVMRMLDIVYGRMVGHMVLDWVKLRLVAMWLRWVVVVRTVIVRVARRGRWGLLIVAHEGRCPGQGVMITVKLVQENMVREIAVVVIVVCRRGVNLSRIIGELVHRQDLVWIWCSRFSRLCSSLHSGSEAELLAHVDSRSPLSLSRSSPFSMVSLPKCCCFCYLPSWLSSIQFQPLSRILMRLRLKLVQLFADGSKLRKLLFRANERGSCASIPPRLGINGSDGSSWLRTSAKIASFHEPMLNAETAAAVLQFAPWDHMNIWLGRYPDYSLLLQRSWIFWIHAIQNSIINLDMIFHWNQWMNRITAFQRAERILVSICNVWIMEPSRRWGKMMETNINSIGSCEK